MTDDIRVEEDIDEDLYRPAMITSSITIATFNDNPVIYDTAMPLRLYEEEFGEVLFIVSMVNVGIPKDVIDKYIDNLSKNYNVKLWNKDDILSVLSCFVSQILEAYRLDPRVDNMTVYTTSNATVDAGQHDTGINVIYNFIMRVLSLIIYPSDADDKIKTLFENILPVLNLLNIDYNYFKIMNLSRNTSMTMDKMNEGGEMNIHLMLTEESLFENMYKVFVNFMQYSFHYHKMYNMDETVKTAYKDIVSLIDAGMKAEDSDLINDAFSDAFLGGKDKKKYIYTLTKNLYSNIDLIEGKSKIWH